MGSSAIDKSIDTTMRHIQPMRIEEELKSAFLEYAMSVVVSRALPDVRDGLKPVHRRILYSMYLHGFHYNKPYHKSVRIVGDVLGKYHPHGDQAVYNTMVGMVQNFSKRYPLLDGQGNWGSIDGDNAAAMRYTEVRMQKITQELLTDIDKETVEFVPNFDESTTEPVILPSKLPHLLINGTAGIAVGMATAIPPHNLTEVINASLAMLANEHITDDELFAHIPGPDFPTGGIICGTSGIRRAYLTGRGNVVVRGVVDIEETKKGSSLIITQLPYQVIKADLIIKIADLVKNKEIDGITNIRDESDKQGMRLVIDIRRGETPQVILNQLYKFTQLQSSVTVLMLALLDNRPLIFTLRQLIREFLIHRQEIIYKRSRYDLKRAHAREHILQGFLIALGRIEDIIAQIKASSTPEDALQRLNTVFGLSSEQGKALLEMRLQRLTGMEQDKIKAEMVQIKESIAHLTAIISDKEKLKAVVAQELEEIKAQYADKRRTKIEAAIDDFTQADLVPDEEVVVTLTRKGYIKRVPLTTYGLQHRGGKGKMGTAALDESDDVIQDIFVTRNHDELLFFTNLGRIYSLPVYQIPEASRTAKGRAIVNLIQLQDQETVVKLLCTRDLDEKYLVMVTRKGTIKRVLAVAFAKIRSTGIRAITLNEGDELAFCALSSGADSIILATAHGFGIRFKEDEVRAMGRQAAGVRGIKLRGTDHVIGMEVVSEDKDILFATERGFGKRVRVVDFRVAHRGGMGVRTIPTTTRNGNVIGLIVVDDESNVLLIDRAGKIIRLPSKEIRTMGRQAQGVRLIRLDEDQILAAVVAADEHQTPASAQTIALPEQDFEDQVLEEMDSMQDAELEQEADVEETEEVDETPEADSQDE